MVSSAQAGLKSSGAEDPHLTNFRLRYTPTNSPLESPDGHPSSSGRSYNNTGGTDASTVTGIGVGAGAGGYNNGGGGVEGGNDNNVNGGAVGSGGKGGGRSGDGDGGGGGGERHVVVGSGGGSVGGGVGPRVRIPCLDGWDSKS